MLKHNNSKHRVTLLKVLCFSLLPLTLCATSVQANEPWNIIDEQFSNGFNDWERANQHRIDLSQESMNTQLGTYAAYLSKKNLVTDIDEATLRFSLNPNNSDIPSAISIATLKGANEYNLWSLRLSGDSQGGFKLQLTWQSNVTGSCDTAYGSFVDIANTSWSDIAISYKANDYVELNVNGNSYRSNNVTHCEQYGDRVYVGQLSDKYNTPAPSGNLLIDDVKFQVASVTDLWVNNKTYSKRCVSGSGLSENSPFCTIQEAANRAGPGTTVHILPGIYRETITPSLSGTATKPVLYKAEYGPNTVSLLGSEVIKNWQPVTDRETLKRFPNAPSLYYADISSYKLSDSPLFLMRHAPFSDALYTRYPIAREPNWETSYVVGHEAENDWQYAKNWWHANGGEKEATGSELPTSPQCEDKKDCDENNRSRRLLTDTVHFPTLGDLSGATLVALTNKLGHDLYRTQIVSEPSINETRIMVAEDCGITNNTNGCETANKGAGLGWGSAYYIENLPKLLNAPGEWWFDKVSQKLYFSPPDNTDPNALNLELSVRDFGIKLAHGGDIGSRSHVIFDGLSLTYFNHSAVLLESTAPRFSTGITLNNLKINFADYGIYLYNHSNGETHSAITQFTLKNSNIGFIDSQFMKTNYRWDGNYTHAGISDLNIENNEFHHVGFRASNSKEGGNGATFNKADKIKFINNYVHHIAHNGVLFARAHIESDLTTNIPKDAIKTGDLLIANNRFEQTCQLTADCGGLKFWGEPGEPSHVFRDTLVINNQFSNVIGWTYIAEQREGFSGGIQSDIKGMGGYGLYIDMAAGIHVYRNIAYNNALAGFSFAGAYEMGDIVLMHNIAANSLYGVYLSDWEDDVNSQYTRILNNILINNEAYGILRDGGNADYGNFMVDHNFYEQNGWRSSSAGGVHKPGDVYIYRDLVANEHYPSMHQITNGWEQSGINGQVLFANYPLDDHSFGIKPQWPDFRLTAKSDAIDRTTDLEVYQRVKSIAEDLEAIHSHPLGSFFQAQGLSMDHGAIESAYLKEYHPPVLAQQNVELKLDETSGSTAYNSASAPVLGTLINQPQWIEEGVENGALWFDQQTRYVTLGQDNAFDFNPALDDFTVSIWFKTSQSGALVSKVKSYNELVQYYLYVGSVDKKLYSKVGDDTLNSHISVNDDKWHLATLVNQNGEHSLYLDGQFIDYHTSNNVLSSNTDLLLGARRHNNNTNVSIPFNGILDEFLIYPAALTGYQVQAIYQSSVD
ncbi:LamG-like jellyroll fold domain-containing protein [Pseudoalteromonas byunsanensis]|uniref:Laminin G domain-containing protein n=1 Tax=Pseudoalteromonas byunsanensis TaxID=327939 RepID=A0A1S1N8A9_9GAMM|nr:LamG-like jellyroll fold domain-containing protein [Pseudoalteromonas byunsanensis]OHU94494.1 hypothetical protein BIW53_15600 [Pseudoalteromonas byunsanensis]